MSPGVYVLGLDIDFSTPQSDIEPRCEFGFGLSYTNFTYSNLQARAVHQSDTTFASPEADWAAGKAGASGEGSSTALWLHRPAFEVSFEVENSGSVAGGEVRPFFTLNLTANAMMLTSCTDPATVPTLPLGRGRTPERAPWLCGRPFGRGTERDGDYYAVAV